MTPYEVLYICMIATLVGVAMLISYALGVSRGFKMYHVAVGDALDQVSKNKARNH